MEKTTQFAVLIQSIGSVLVTAHTKYHAKQVAYTRYCSKVSDIKRYTVVPKRNRI